MEIEPISFASFKSPISCAHALREAENDGCGWYATMDRRVAGRIYMDAKTEQFRISVLHFVRAGWAVNESYCGCDTFDAAECELFQAMGELVGKPVTVKDVPMRLRFGKGRTGQRKSRQD